MTNIATASALSSGEQSRLARCERTIEKGISTFREVGQALLEVNEGRLYRREYETFADYCKGKWDFTRQRAHQLMDAAKVAEECQPVVDIPNERVARELAAVPEEKRPDVLDWATEQADGKPLTAAAIRKAAEQFQEQEPEEDEAEVPAAELEEFFDAPPDPEEEAGDETTAAELLFAVLDSWATMNSVGKVALRAMLENYIEAEL